MALKFQFSQEGDLQHIFFGGPINEDAEVALQQLLGQLTARCAFNFQAVEFINSCGVRAWINFMREAEKGRKIEFENCTPDIVMQMNMIPSFKGTAQVSSAYAAYSCADCGHQKTVLFQAGSTLPTSAGAEIPAIPCDKCGKTMEMEEIEDEYFAFAQAG